MQDFRNLDVWHRASAVALRIDGLIRGFPRTGHATLKSQLGRAAGSISANIAEGCGAASQREFARYIDIAIKSTTESQHHVIQAHERSLISDKDHDELVDELVQIRRMLYGLRKKVLLDLDDDPRPRPRRRRGKQGSTKRGSAKRGSSTRGRAKPGQASGTRSPPSAPLPPASREDD